MENLQIMVKSALVFGKTPATPTGSFRKFDEVALAKLDKRYRKLAKNIRNNRGSSNNADIKALQELYLLTWELIPLAKENYKQYRSDRGIYALNGLVNQIREIQNDLRQLRTGKKQHAHIINKILLPNLTLLLQHYMTDCFELRKLVSRVERKQRDRLNTALNNMMQSHGLLFDELSGKIQSTLAEYLVS
jgi:hypothetical protein